MKNKSPHMTITYKVKPKWIKKIPGVVHIDKTARVQTINKEQNKNLYNILKEFYKITNVPVILNTSFNDAGEPIVETPLDALICFFSTVLSKILPWNFFSLLFIFVELSIIFTFLKFTENQNFFRFAYYYS